MKATLLVLFLLFGIYTLFYLSGKNNILFIILFIPYLGFVINDFKKMKSKKYHYFLKKCDFKKAMFFNNRRNN